MSAAGRAGLHDETRTGYLAGVSAYFLWGLSVIFYKWVAHVPAIEVIAHRVVWTVVLIGVFLALAGRLAEVGAAWRDRDVRRRLLITGSIIGGNWLIFVWAIAQDRILEVSFGYFINPLVSVLLGVVLLGERLGRLQMVAIGLAVIAVAIQAAALSGFPWISLSLAFSFAAYGYFRKLAPVGASPGLFVETMLMLPIALVFIAWLEAGGSGHFTLDWLTALLLVLTGAVTGIPLILFATAARRLPLTMVGLLQYLAPSLQFVIAVLLYSEPLSLPRLASFVLIWIALAVFTYASWRKAG